MKPVIVAPPRQFLQFGMHIGTTGRKGYIFVAGNVPVLVILLGQESTGLRSGEGLTPEGLPPRLRARMLAVTCSLVSLLGQTRSTGLHR